MIHVFGQYVSLVDLPAVDLLIRTGGGLWPVKFLYLASCYGM